jgi:hypothetical protein
LHGAVDAGLMSMSMVVVVVVVVVVVEGVKTSICLSNRITPT